MVCLVRRGHAASLCVPPLRQTAGAGAGAEPTGNLQPALGRPQSGFGWGALSCPWWRPGRRAHPEGPRDFWFPNFPAGHLVPQSCAAPAEGVSSLEFGILPPDHLQTPESVSVATARGVHRLEAVEQLPSRSAAESGSAGSISSHREGRSRHSFGPQQRGGLLLGHGLPAQRRPCDGRR